MNPQKLKPRIITPEEFISPAWFPLFALESRDLIERFIQESELECSMIWATRRKSGVAWLTAHKLAMNLHQAGQLSSAATLAAEGKAVDLPSSSGVQNWGVLATFYGQQYERLKAQIPRVGFVV